LIEEDNINTIIEAIRSEKDDFVRLYALNLLKDHSQRNSTVPFLLELINDKSTKICAKAVEVLGKIKTDKAIEAIKKALSSESWEVRKTAIRALGEQDNIQITELIVPALFDSNWEVRNEAAIVLDYYKWKPSNLEEKTAYLISKEKWEKIINEEKVSVPIILSFLNDSEPEIRRNIILTVGERKITDPKAVEILLKLLMEDENYDIREKAAEALAKIGTEKAFKALQVAGKSEVWFARKCVASALRFYKKDKNMLKLLKTLLHDENLYVRKAAKETTIALLEKHNNETSHSIRYNN